MSQDSVTRRFEAYLPDRCKTYPDFVKCCPDGCRLYLAMQIGAWDAQGSVNNARMFSDVLKEGDYNPNTKHREAGAE